MKALLVLLLLAAPAYADSITQLYRGFDSICMDHTRTSCPNEPTVRIDVILTVQPYNGPVWNSWFQTFLNGPAWEVIDLDGRLNGQVMTFSPPGIHGISWLPAVLQSPPGFWLEFKVGDRQSFINFDSVGATLLWEGGSRLQPAAFNPDAFTVPEFPSAGVLLIGLSAMAFGAWRLPE